MDDNNDTCDLISMLKGNVHAFEQLFRKYYVSLCNYSQGIVADKNTAEDIVQDSFIYLWNNRNSIKINQSLKAYLYSSVRNGSLNHLKRKLMEQKHTPLLTEFLHYLQETEYSETELMELERVKKALEELPDQCRTIFLMNCMEEKSYKEIATELQISVNTVKTHLKKANQRLREGIDKEIFTFLLIRVKLQQSDCK